MSNGGRQAHCKRVFKLNDDGTIDSSIWIDVLRIDQTPVNFQPTDSGIQGQIINLFIYWNDDPNHPMQGIDGSTADIQGENANADRETEKLEIKNPDNAPDDSSQSNYLWIVDRLPLAFSGDGSGIIGQVINFIFDNGDGKSSATGREISVVKVVNNDLNGLKMADDDGKNPIIVDAFDYLQAMKAGVKDDSQHLNVEIVDRFSVNFQSSDDGVEGQTINFILANDDLENFLDPGDGNATPPPVRTDPLQAIVNVGYGAGKFTFVSAGSTESEVFWAVSAFSTDGIKWESINSATYINGPATAFFYSIRGKSADGKTEIVMAAGASSYPTTDTVGNPIVLQIPIVAISTNHGASWGDAGFPFIPPSLEVGVNSHPDTYGVGYHAKEKQFYVRGDGPSGLGVYSYPDWGFVGEYPSGTKVCDEVTSRQDLIYCSSFNENQIVKAGGHDIALSTTGATGIVVNGITVPVGLVPTAGNVAAGSGIICVGGIDADINSVMAMSRDWGKSWEPIPALAGIYGSGQGGGFTPDFTCS